MKKMIYKIIPMCILMTLLLGAGCWFIYVSFSYPRRYHSHMRTDPDELEMYNYNRDFPLEWPVAPYMDRNGRMHRDPTMDVQKRATRPLFPAMHSRLPDNLEQFRCHIPATSQLCQKRTDAFKQLVLYEFQRTMLEQSNVLVVGARNPYLVPNVEPMKPVQQTSGSRKIQLWQDLKNVPLSFLRPADIANSPVAKALNPNALLERERKKTCAIVSSAGSMIDSAQGAYIDAHQVVVRFNDAPTRRYVGNVGQKTHIRVVNSQVLANQKHNFVTDPIFQNVTLIVWDPSAFNSSINEWIRKPEYPFIDDLVNYYERNKATADIHLLNPHTLWSLWNFLQRHTSVRIRRNPPSSGFIALATMMHMCEIVNFFDFVPTTRLSKACHYYDPDQANANDLHCTFGVWHPLAAEKLLAYTLNLRDDRSVFQCGIVTFRGFSLAEP